ncbi:MAG: NADH-quinone oxidoreductase subunit A, partial [Thermoguttaceae bacterium]
MGLLFVLFCLLLGKLLRPSKPTVQKRETYECGEPAVGSGSVQFDLRFYVVALLFLIFEVEVALFFPTATIFGRANQERKATVAAAESKAPPTASAAKKATTERAATAGRASSADL